MVVDNLMVVGGMESEEDKTWAAFYSKSQSLVSSLCSYCLIYLSRLWFWFQHLCYLLVSGGGLEGGKDNTRLKYQEEGKQIEIKDNNCIKIKDLEEHEGDDSNSIAESDECVQEEIDQAVLEISNQKVKINDIKSIDEMTIQAMVNPDQNEDLEQEVHTFSMPIALRLNSNVSEVSSDHDEDLILDELHERRGSQKLEGQTEEGDNCSGYCSGSGSSLPGSPIPSSNLKEHNIHLHNNNNLSSDEHENDAEAESVNGDEHDGTLGLGPNVERRDSDSSTGSEEVEISPEVVGRIVYQVESMFSDDHLAKDGFLLKHVRRRSDGFVSLKLVAGLRKVKQISREFPVVLNALKTSDSLEVNTEGTKIRRKEPLTSELKAMPIKQAKKDKTGGPGGDKEKYQAEKENLSDEQQLARKRRQKGDRLNELHYERGQHQAQQYGQQNQYYKSGSSGRSSFSSISDETPLRRRGGSLPITALSQHRGSTAGNYLYPNASPPNAASGFLRPKSNSYSEGTDPSAATMSSWLQKRKASAASTRLSSGEISLTGVIRQPRGPDGTKGFHLEYMKTILHRKMLCQTE